MDVTEEDCGYNVGIQNQDGEEPFQDSGSEYIPTRSPSPSSVDLAHAIGDENVSPNIGENRKPRKRVRNERNWKNNIRKEKRARGEQYINSKGNLVAAKQININAPCNCVKKCHEKIKPDQQNELFKAYYDLGNFDLRSSYLFFLISVSPKHRSSIPTDQVGTSRHSYTRVCHVSNAEGLMISICKDLFKKIFQVSDGRISRVLKNKLTVFTPPVDKRGQYIPPNKTSDEKIQEVKSFIEHFPKYESHYTLHKSLNRKYLAPDLNQKNLYSLYSDEFPDEEERVSEYIFRKTFNEQFNLAFHAPISVKKHDYLDIKTAAADDQEEKTSLDRQNTLYLL